MRYSLLIAAAALFVVQAAPVAVGPKASAEPLAPSRCWKVDGEWECSGGDGPDPRSEPRASAEPLAPSRCWKVDGEWECSGGEGPDPHSGPQASAEPLAPSRCWKVDGEWECSGGDGPDPHSEPQAATAELEAIDPYSGGSSPSHLPCRTVGKKTYCDSIKK